MPQVQKPGVDARMRDAALRRFAADGYASTSMSSIAAAAGVATGNLYRYYPQGKRQLFEAVITDELARTLDVLVRDRVLALLLPLHDPHGKDSPHASELLDFWIEHRLQVVVLLARAEGTQFASYGAQFTQLLVDLAVERIQRDGGETDDSTLHVLRTIFDNTRHALVAILERHEQPEKIRRAVEGFWAYQLPGLEGFHSWATRRRK